MPRFGDSVLKLGQRYPFDRLMRRGLYQLVDSRPSTDPEWLHILSFMASHLEVEMVVCARRWIDDPANQEIGVWAARSWVTTYRRYMRRFHHQTLATGILALQLSMMEGDFQLVQLVRPEEDEIRVLLQLIDQSRADIFLCSSMAPATMLVDGIAAWMRPED